jgi:predicted nucleotidyltransferase
VWVILTHWTKNLQYLLYLTVRGSNAYGTNIPTSDIDFAGVFIQSHDDILGNKYLEQINDSTNDTVIYELRRFWNYVEQIILIF